MVRAVKAPRSLDRDMIHESHMKWKHKDLVMSRLRTLNMSSASCRWRRVNLKVEDRNTDVFCLLCGSVMRHGETSLMKKDNKEIKIKTERYKKKSLWNIFSRLAFFFLPGDINSSWLTLDISTCWKHLYYFWNPRSSTNCDTSRHTNLLNCSTGMNKVFSVWIWTSSLSSWQKVNSSDQAHYETNGLKHPGL